jgi:hypothetical protein
MMTISEEFESKLKLLGMSNQLLLADLNRIEKEFDIELQVEGGSIGRPEDTYYPQFDANIRQEAGEMAKYYEIFYCLEKSIRALVVDSLESEEGQGWWNSGRVPPAITQAVEKRIQNDVDAGVTLRSTEDIDYTTFGELGDIITANWDVFGAIFNSRRAVQKILSNLNTLRGPIAHCSRLAPDEETRLQLSVRDWFRLME